MLGRDLRFMSEEQPQSLADQVVEVKRMFASLIRKLKAES